MYRYRDNDFKPYVFRTNDYGKSWELLTNNNGIPTDHFVRAVVEDKNVRGLIYAGTEFGIYVSFDDGKSWQKIQQNLPVVPITDLEIQDNRLAISTQGRSFWVSDDLSPIQGAAGFGGNGNIFYKPADAYRTEIYGKNAEFAFYLADNIDSTTKASIEIIDLNGNLLRKYTTDPDEKAGEQKLSVKRGFNSLNWNLRVNGPELVPDFVSMVLRNPAQGARVPDGEYTVRLSVGDWQSSQKLVVRIDPNWSHVKHEGLVKQYEMGVEIAEMIDKSHRVIENIRGIRTQANDLARRAQDAGQTDKLKESASVLDAALTKVEDMIIQNKVQTSQDAINYPRKFSNHIGRVYSVLTYSEAGPTAGIIERYDDVKKEFAEIEASYTTVMANEFAAFTNLLKEENVDYIIIPNKVDND